MARGPRPRRRARRVRVAGALGSLPRLAHALARGELSYSKVRALTRVATPETEERLLNVGKVGTAAHVERIVRGWRPDRLEEAKQTALRHSHRGVQVYDDEDGMVVVRGRLEPEAGEVLKKALAPAQEVLYRRRRADVPAQRPVHLDVNGHIVADPPSWGQQLADALVLVAETALHHGMDPGPAGERYQVVIHVDAPMLADADPRGQSVMEDGTHVSAETSQRLACDTTRVVMRHDANGQVTEVGARTRTIPPALRRALEHRDQGCHSVRVTTSNIGRTEDLPRCRISRCCVVGTIARSTSMAIGSSDCRMASCASGIRTGRRCPPSHLRLACLRIPSKLYARRMRRTA